jgi:hypothetical protein
MQGSRKAHNSESTLDITCSLNYEVRRLPDQCFPMLPLASLGAYRWTAAREFAMRPDPSRLFERSN